MKRNFSQPFEKEPNRAHIFVQDSVTKEFVLLRSLESERAAYEFTRLPRLELAEGDAVYQLAKHLHKQGFAAASFRELARLAFLRYSFVDNTPGVTHDVVCYHVVVDRTIRLGDSVYGRRIEWLNLAQLTAVLRSHDLPKVVELGLAKLDAEERSERAPTPQT